MATYNDTEYCHICQARMLYIPRREYARETNALGVKSGPYRLVLDHIFYICPNACLLIGVNHKTGSSHQLYLPALVVSADEREANKKEWSSGKHERPKNGAIARLDERKEHGQPDASSD